MTAESAAKLSVNEEALPPAPAPAAETAEAGVAAGGGGEGPANPPGVAIVATSGVVPSNKGAAGFTGRVAWLPAAPAAACRFGVDAPPSVVAEEEPVVGGAFRFNGDARGRTEEEEEEPPAAAAAATAARPTA